MTAAEADGASKAITLAFGLDPSSYLRRSARPDASPDGNTASTPEAVHHGRGRTVGSIDVDAGCSCAVSAASWPYLKMVRTAPTVRSGLDRKLAAPRPGWCVLSGGCAARVAAGQRIGLVRDHYFRTG